MQLCSQQRCGQLCIQNSIYIYKVISRNILRYTDVIYVLVPKDFTIMTPPKFDLAFSRYLGWGRQISFLFFEIDALSLVCIWGYRK
jgi:hypothetical protein